MKKIVLHTLTLLLASTLAGTTAMAHNPPTAESGTNEIRGFYNVMGVLTYWDPVPKRDTTGNFTTVDVKVGKDNLKHVVDFEHDEVLNSDDLKEALAGSPNRWPGIQTISNVRAFYSIFSRAEEQLIGRIVYCIDSINNAVSPYNTLDTRARAHAKGVLEKIRDSVLDAEDVSKNATIDFVDLILIGNDLLSETSHRYAWWYPTWTDVNRSALIDMADIVSVVGEIEDTSVQAAKDALVSAELSDKGGVKFTVEHVNIWLATTTVKKSHGTVTALENLKTALAATADVDGSGAVDFKDLILVGNAVKNAPPVAGTHPDADRSGGVDIDDIIFVANEIKVTSKSSAIIAIDKDAIATRPVLFSTLDVDAWIEKVKVMVSEHQHLVKVLDILAYAPISAGVYVDNDDDVDFEDLIIVGNAIKTGNTVDNTRPDVDKEGSVDVHDLVYVAASIFLNKATSEAIKTALTNTPAQFTAQDVDPWIEKGNEINAEHVVSRLKLLKAALPSADVDGSGVVDFKDLILVGNAIKNAPPVAGTHPDANRSGGVDIDDIIFVADRISPIDAARMSILDVLWSPILSTKPVFTGADILTWKAQATGDAVTVLEQLSKGLVVDWMDVDGNGAIDFEDLIKVGNAIHGNTPPGVNPNANRSHNSTPDIDDIISVASGVAQGAKSLKDAQDAVQNTRPEFTAADVDTWIAEAEKKSITHVETVLQQLKQAVAALSPAANADVDGSRTIDIVDLIKVANAVKAPNSAPTGTNADGSGDIDSDDIIFVAKALSSISDADLQTAAIANGVAFTETDVDTWVAKASAIGGTVGSGAAKVIKMLRTAPIIARHDVDRDRDVDFEDLIKVGNVVKTGVTPAGVNPDVRILPDGAVNIIDIDAVASFITTNTQQAATAALGATTPSFNVTDIDAWIRTIRGWGRPKSDPAILVLNTLKTALSAPQAPALTQSAADVRVALLEARRLNADPATIASLERLLARLVQAETPKKTVLLTNYPNPFNPETWIPYHLATPAKVNIAIYAADGKLIRTLDLGHLPAGRYQEKSSAAYWDGRNAQGEPVASGLYFYTFTAGEFTATKKMLIRK